MTRFFKRTTGLEPATFGLGSFCSPRRDDDRCMLLSFQLLPEQPASQLLDAIAVADELGYYSCYSADEIYHKDAWLL